MHGDQDSYMSLVKATADFQSKSRCPPYKKGSRQEAYRLNYLKNRLGSLTLSSIQSKHIASYRDLRLKEGKSGATVVYELNYLYQLFDVALKDWGIPLVSNPAQLVRRPSVARGRNRRLSEGEVDSLLESLKATDEVRTIVCSATISLSGLTTTILTG